MRGLILGIERSSLLVWSHWCGSRMGSYEDRGQEAGSRPMVVAERASRTAEEDRDRLFGGLGGEPGGPAVPWSRPVYPVAERGRSALFP